MKKKRIFGVLSAAVVLAAAACGAVACGGGGGNGGTDPGTTPGVLPPQKEDKEKVQLYVFNFNGGYGSSWLVKAAQRYEERMKDATFDAFPGKKGVQIMINAQKKVLTDMQTSILTNQDEVYFTEYAYYNALRQQGYLGEITDAVKGDLASYGDTAGTTIESKLTPEHKDYFDVGGKYYGIPHYSGYMGITYSIDIFEDKKAYFLADPVNDTLAGKFQRSNPAGKRSAGPDGVEGTDDDGLPVTYDDFYDLCDFLSQASVTPFVWIGQSYKQYLSNFGLALAAQNDGLQRTMLMYNMNGTADNLGSVVDGAWVADAEATTINEGNAYKLMNQKGRYDALTFLEKIMTTEKWRNKGDVFGANFSQFDAQNKFIKSGFTSRDKNYGMLIDGIWWESEATTTFNALAEQRPEFAKSQRKFGWMPLPQATASAPEDYKVTLFDQMYSMCFMKANIADAKKEIAYDFIKFCNSDEELVKFTQETNVPKALNYTMTAEQMNELTTFGKSLMNIKSRADIVYPMGSSTIFQTSQTTFAPDEMFKVAKNKNAIESIWEEKKTAASVFGSVRAYWESFWQEKGWKA